MCRYDIGKVADIAFDMGMQYQLFCLKLLLFSIMVFMFSFAQVIKGES